MKKRVIYFIGVALLIIVWIITIILIGPNNIVDAIGEENGYLLAFVIAVAGGVSTLTSSTFTLTIITLVAGGLSPYILGVVGGTGLLIGDSLFYYLGSNVSYLLSGQSKKWIDKLSAWLENRPKWLVPGIVFVYVGFFPLPNDVLTVTLGLGSYRYRRIVLPIWLGNILFTIIVGVLTQHGYQLI